MSLPTPKDRERAVEVVFEGGGISCPATFECKKDDPCVCCAGAIDKITKALVDERERTARKCLSILTDGRDSLSARDTILKEFGLEGEK